MSRKQLSKKEIRELVDQIRDSYGIQDTFSKKENVEIVDEKFIIKDGKTGFFLHEGKPVPTLGMLLRDNFLKTVTVDMGAVKFVASGADVMRPGVVAVDDGISEGEVVAVVDERNRKPLAVGTALMDSEKMLAAANGKVVKSVHFVGDDIWTFINK